MKPFIPVSLTFVFIASVAVIQEYSVGSSENNEDLNPLAANGSTLNVNTNRTARIINTENSPIFQALKDFWLAPLSQPMSVNEQHGQLHKEGQMVLRRQGDFQALEDNLQLIRPSDCDGYHEKMGQMELSSKFWKRCYFRMKSCIESCFKQHDCSNQTLETSNIPTTENSSAASLTSPESNLSTNSQRSPKSDLSENVSKPLASDKIINKTTPESEDSPIFKVFHNIWFQALSFSPPPIETLDGNRDGQKKLNVQEIQDPAAERVDTCSKVTKSLRRLEKRNTSWRRCHSDHRSCIDMCIAQHDCMKND